MRRPSSGTATPSSAGAHSRGDGAPLPPALAPPLLLARLTSLEAGRPSVPAAAAAAAAAATEPALSLVPPGHRAPCVDRYSGTDCVRGGGGVAAVLPPAPLVPTAVLPALAPLPPALPSARVKGEPPPAPGRSAPPLAGRETSVLLAWLLPSSLGVPGVAGVGGESGPEPLKSQSMTSATYDFELF